MKALIDPISSRLCQVEVREFDVAAPMFWIDCDATVSPNTHSWSAEDGIYEIDQSALVTYGPPAVNEAYVQLLSQYPVVNVKMADKVIRECSTDALKLEIHFRHNGDAVGVACTALRGMGTELGTIALMQMRTFRETALGLGVPVFSLLDGEEQHRRQIADYNVNVMGQMEFDLDGVPFMYSPWDLAIIKNRKRRIIEADRDRAIADGVTWNGHVWDCDDVSRSNLTGVVASVNAGVPLPGGFVWRTKDNQNVSMDAEQVVELGAAMLTHVNNAYQESWTRKSAVDAATTEEQVNNA